MMLQWKEQTRDNTDKPFEVINNGELYKRIKSTAGVIHCMTELSKLVLHTAVNDG